MRRVSEQGAWPRGPDLPARERSHAVVSVEDATRADAASVVVASTGAHRPRRDPPGHGRPEVEVDPRRRCSCGCTWWPRLAGTLGRRAG